MQEAINQVKTELGRDAVILHTRRLKKGGVLGLFSKECFEVMAAIDATPKMTPPSSQTPVHQPAKPVLTPETQNLLALRQDVSTLQKMMESVIVSLPKSETAISPLADLLIKNDIEPEIARVLTKGMPEIIAKSHPTVLRDLLKERLCSFLTKIEPIVLDEETPRIAAFVGPTGVGKTTTIAKLAANFSLKAGCRVALITADTYRIAALEQLKTYADIIGVPLDIVYTPQELKNAITRHRDKNLILIDTAGRSPKNQQQIDELQALLAVEPATQIYLVMSTTTKYKEALDIVNRFSVCSPTKFLFTKTDEASNLGTIFNLLYRFPIALSYITVGQNVPEDIEVADPQKLATMILRD